MLELTEANWDEEVNWSPLPVVVDFYATWCGPCRRLEPVIRSLDTRLQGKVKVAKVNVDKSGLATRHRVQSIPTLVLFKNGGEVSRKVGAHSEGAYLDWLRQNGVEVEGPVGSGEEPADSSPLGE